MPKESPSNSWWNITAIKRVVKSGPDVIDRVRPIINEWIMIPNCNTLTGVSASGEPVNKTKVKPHKYANDLPLFSHFNLPFASIMMVVSMGMMMFMCICEVLGTLKPIAVIMVRFTVVHVTRTAWSTLRILRWAIHGCWPIAFVMRQV
jgi:hypothetical protein